MSAKLLEREPALRPAGGGESIKMLKRLQSSPQAGVVWAKAAALESLRKFEQDIKI